MANGRKIGKATWQRFLLKVSLFLIAPDDVPLGIAEKSVVFGARVAMDAGGQRGTFARLRSWRTELALKRAAPAAKNLKTNEKKQKKN